MSILGAILLSSLILFALVFSLCVVGYIHVYDQIFSLSNMPCVIWCISLYSRVLLITSSTLPTLNIAPPSCSHIVFPWSCMCLVSRTFFLRLFSTQLSQLLPVSASFYGSASPFTNGRFHLQLFFRPWGICLFMGSAVLQTCRSWPLRTQATSLLCLCVTYIIQWTPHTCLEQMLKTLILWHPSLEILFSRAELNNPYFSNHPTWFLWPSDWGGCACPVIGGGSACPLVTFLPPYGIVSLASNQTGRRPEPHQGAKKDDPTVLGCFN